jgi:hypothetical protein
VADADALRAACEVARELGLRVGEPRRLPGRSNLLVRLWPAPVVARVATGTAKLRSGDAWFAREVALASHLARAGAPVVPPSDEILPGPHTRDGWILSFWRFVDELPTPVDPVAAGRALRECHESARDFPGSLPERAPLVEGDAILARVIERRAARPAELAVLERARERVAASFALGLPVGALHGDAVYANALAAKGGPLWNDWEDCFRGPLAWDLASLVSRARALGDDRERSAALLAGHGAAIEPELLDRFVEARIWWTTLWGLELLLAGDRSALRVEERLRWLSARDH